MSKQKRPPARTHAEKASRESSTESSLTEQSVMGNSALQAQIEGVSADGPQADIEAVRSEAMPIVERAMIALYTEPRPPERIERFVNVLESSKLPADRKAVLIEKLVSEQDAALAVASAAERWFGSSDLETRTEALGAMDGLWDALEKGTPGEGAWNVADQTIELTPSEGTLGERAEQLMADLAQASAGPELGEAIQGFCQEVYLIVAWHQEEEEEEEEAGEPAAPEE